MELDKLRRAEPGPRDENVLVLQGQHRSRLIWDADRERPEEYSKLRVRRVETQLRRLPPPSPAVLELVQQAGLEGLLRVPFMQLDLALITALIERWRPETHLPLQVRGVDSHTTGCRGYFRFASSRPCSYGEFRFGECGVVVPESFGGYS